MRSKDSIFTHNKIQWTDSILCRLDEDCPRSFANFSLGTCDVTNYFVDILSSQASNATVMHHKELEHLENWNLKIKDVMITKYHEIVILRLKNERKSRGFSWRLSAFQKQIFRLKFIEKKKFQCHLYPLRAETPATLFPRTFFMPDYIQICTTLGGFARGWQRNRETFHFLMTENVLERSWSFQNVLFEVVIFVTDTLDHDKFYRDQKIVQEVFYELVCG